MKKIIIFLLICLTGVEGTSLFVQEKREYLILDAPIQNQAPRNFRSFVKTGIPVRVSGSGQIGSETLLQVVDGLDSGIDTLWVVDLREESHGLINGIPVSWTDGTDNALNRDKTLDQIVEDEKYRLDNLLGKEILLQGPDDSFQTLIAHHVATEKEWIESVGGNYLRFPVTDHDVPSKERVEGFLRFFQSLDSTVWVHIHCKAGKGRTTTFMAMIDILKHAHEKTLEEILERQHLAGGSNLVDFNDKDDYRRQLAKERVQFLDGFYVYVRETEGKRLSWSDWLHSEAHHMSFANNDD